MDYFDLHCDTLLEITRTGDSLMNSKRMVDLAHHPFREYTQVLAVFSYPTLSPDEAYAQFERCYAHLTSMERDLPHNFHPILSVENALLLGDRPERLERLARAGVRLMNPVWAGENLLGGAWDTHIGLTAYGKTVIQRAYQNKIVPDLSHASDEMAKEILTLALQKSYPVLASHSCARAIHPHGRNLPDAYFREIMASGGVVGLSFYPHHLTDGDSVCDKGTIRRHLEHYLSLGGEDHLAIGADWDGIECTPDGVASIGDIPALSDYLSKHGWSQTLLNKVFYQNAADFFHRLDRLL